MKSDDFRQARILWLVSCASRLCLDDNDDALRTSGGYGTDNKRKRSIILVNPKTKRKRSKDKSDEPVSPPKNGIGCVLLLPNLYLSQKNKSCIQAYKALCVPL